MNIVALITKYGYAVIFPLAVIEGPILSIVSGLLVSLGLLNIFLVYSIIVTGDIIGDMILYAVGRWGGTTLLKWFGPRLKLTPEKTESAKAYFNEHGFKAIIMSKLLHGVGITGLIAAGTLKIPYKQFFSDCVKVSFTQYAIFLFIGVLFGRVYVQLGKYLNYYASAVMIGAVFIVLYIILIKKFKFTFRQ